ncbi:polysaccharide deacetylase family protein [Dermatophilus congolensis]|uniref:polysaccharide deacetylase family protein n=6 Tax=Dermatophilus congolensis TaxID=1863 RepID=UPI001AB05553|nr:polysaccharide deacetylase family protein [Dermatophilus congolensis]MBO3143565.1 polysaccharide deacetylase family protein [Dermatophilus congolensis]MBO3163842.1 polysaccharide deacetylase family protein [Dermatophilus congolensis]MBO3177389.1 polysaccharide deacetylase family protein [Dermatophilus congolensis]MBO3216828.1 polysaccharide deacetylase family protein [Dermatophilus congolensis]
MSHSRLSLLVMSSAAVALLTIPALDRAFSEGNSTLFGHPTATPSPTVTVTVPPTSTPTPSRPHPTPAHTPVTKSPEGKRKIVYLTLDDGPSPYTTKALEILSRHNVPATFFMIGEEAAQYPETAAKVRAAGHAIGNHTYTHPWLTHLSTPEIRKQLQKTDDILGKTTCMRPPGGLINKTVIAQANKLDKSVINWDVDTRDWQRPGTVNIRSTALRLTTPGSIILMHDGGGNRTQSIGALDGIISTLKSRGYTFATLPQCR